MRFKELARFGVIRYSAPLKGSWASPFYGTIQGTPLRARRVVERASDQAQDPLLLMGRLMHREIR